MSDTRENFLLNLYVDLFCHHLFVFSTRVILIPGTLLLLTVLFFVVLQHQLTFN